MKTFLAAISMIFIPFILAWFFIVKSPTTIKEAIAYQNNNDCINNNRSFVGKNCALAKNILESYFWGLSKDSVINKILMNIKKENIKCDAEMNTKPLCIAMGIRLSEIDSYNIAQPDDIINSVISINIKNQNELAIESSTKIAESILVKMKSK